MSLELKVKGLKELTALAEKAPQVAIKQVNAGIIGALTAVEIEAKKEAPIGVTKDLHNQWTKTTSPLQGKLASQKPYASAVQFGTPPHKVSVEAITPWAELRGLNPWAVAKSIEKKGTKANPFFSRALTNAEPRVNTIFNGIISNIIKELTQ